MAQRTFTVGIPVELEQRVVEAARAVDITRNAFVRRALEAALDPARTREPASPPASANFGAVRRPRRSKPFKPQPKK